MYEDCLFRMGSVASGCNDLGSRVHFLLPQSRPRMRNKVRICVNLVHGLNALFLLIPSGKAALHKIALRFYMLMNNLNVAAELIAFLSSPTEKLSKMFQIAGTP